MRCNSFITIQWQGEARRFYCEDRSSDHEGVHYTAQGSEWDRCDIDNYPWNLNLAEFNGWPREAHRAALLTGNDDLISLTHPTNYLSESEVENPGPQHINRGGYGPHEWDCPACLAESERRKENRKNNPHRPGTKAAAKWDRDRASLDWAMDMRGETYWSM